MHAENQNKFYANGHFYQFQYECTNETTAPSCLAEFDIEQLPNSSFSASSVHESSKPHYVKFNTFRNENNYEAFRFGIEDNFQWLQIDFDAFINVTGYYLLGGGKLSSGFISSHYLSYSLDCKKYTWYTDSTGQRLVTWLFTFIVTYDIFNSKFQLIKGSQTWSLIRQILLQKPFVARCIQVNPRTWTNTPTFRISIRGCKIPNLDPGMYFFVFVPL